MPRKIQVYKLSPWELSHIPYPASTFESMIFQLSGLVGGIYLYHPQVLELSINLGEMLENPRKMNEYPLKKDHFKRKIVFQASFFRGKMLVFREGQQLLILMRYEKHLVDSYFWSEFTIQNFGSQRSCLRLFEVCSHTIFRDTKWIIAIGNGRRNSQYPHRPGLHKWYNVCICAYYIFSWYIEPWSHVLPYPWVFYPCHLAWPFFSRQVYFFGIPVPSIRAGAVAHV